MAASCSRRRATSGADRQQHQGKAAGQRRDRRHHEEGTAAQPRVERAGGPHGAGHEDAARQHRKQPLGGVTHRGRHALADVMHGAEMGEAEGARMQRLHQEQDGERRGERSDGPAQRGDGGAQHDQPHRPEGLVEAVGEGEHQHLRHDARRPQQADHEFGIAERFEIDRAEGIEEAVARLAQSRRQHEGDEARRAHQGHEGREADRLRLGGGAH